MHPKGRPFSTNLFIGYGAHNLGELKLQRAAGSLNILSTPPAQSVTVRGPEWRKELANVSSEKLAAPADEYTVTAVYPYFTVEKTITVADNQETLCLFTPAVGVLQATFGHAGARFELRRVENFQMQNQVLERGELPATLTGLQAGQYELRAIYQGLVANRPVEITAAHTNQLEVEFSLGSVLLETKPAGATIRDAQGNELGTTPFTLTGVPAGVWRGEVALPNYATVPVAMNVLAKQTVNFQTNLLRRSFATAMALLERSKKESDENFAPLIEAFSAAVTEDPDNEVAVRILNKTRVAQALMKANNKAKSGDLAGALQDADGALALMPEDPDMQQLVANFKKDIQAQQTKVAADNQREAAALRVSRPRDYFAKLMSQTRHSAEFAEQDLTVHGEVADLRTKLADALTKSFLLKFTIEANEQPFAEGFFIQAKLPDLTGFRRCYIVGGQTADGEVTIRFKVFELGWSADAALAGLFGKADEEKAVPITQLQRQPGVVESKRAEGIQMVTERIQKAAER